MLEFELDDFTSVRDLYRTITSQLCAFEDARLVTCEVDEFLDLLR